MESLNKQIRDEVSRNLFEATLDMMSQPIESLMTEELEKELKTFDRDAQLGL